MSVEPGITIGFLNRLLVAEGLSLGVVPEVGSLQPWCSTLAFATLPNLITFWYRQVDHLTVGGLVLGGGLESTSHKYGMFHQVSSLSKQSLWHFNNLNSGAKIMILSAGQRIWAGDSRRRVYQSVSDWKPRPLQSDSHELWHLWISHQDQHSCGELYFENKGLCNCV